MCDGSTTTRSEEESTGKGMATVADGWRQAESKRIKVKGQKEG